MHSIVFIYFIVDYLIKSSPYINTDVELSVGKSHWASSNVTELATRRVGLIKPCL